MASKTLHYMLEMLAAGDPFSTNGQQYTTTDRAAIDRLLYVGAQGHKHNGASVTQANPGTAPGLTLSTTSGSLPAGRRATYEYTLVDPEGFETAPSPSSYVDLPPGPTTPGAPSLAYASGGSLAIGGYYYNVSAYTGTNNSSETAASAAAYISISAAGSIVVTLPTLPSGCTGFNIYRRRPNGSDYLYVTSVTGVTTWTDDGSLPDICNRLAPYVSTAAAQNSVTITLPSALPTGFTWNLYRTTTAGTWTNTFLASIGIPLAGGAVPTTYVDNGSATSAGQPPTTSELIGSPSKIDLTTDVTGQLPPSNVGAYPLYAILKMAGTVTTGELEATWVSEFPAAEVVSARAILPPGSTPAANPVIVDLLKGSGTSPTYTSVYGGSGQPSIAVGAQMSSAAAPSSTVTLNQGDSLVASVLQAGGGATPTDFDLALEVYLLVAVSGSSISTGGGGGGGNDALEAPTNVIASPTQSSTDLIVTWTAPSSGTVESYTVTGRNTTTNSAPFTIDVTGATSATVDVSSEDSTFSAGDMYVFTVTATYASGTSAASSASAAASPESTPNPPTFTSFTPGDGEITVAFAPFGTAYPPITSYLVTCTNGAQQSVESNPVTFTGLTNGDSYGFAIAAFNSVGEGPTSATSQAVTAGVAVSAPVFVGNPSGSQGNTTSYFDITVPSGAAAGDTALLAVQSFETSGITVSGWDLVAEETATPTTGSQTLGMALFARILQTGDIGSTVQINIPGSPPYEPPAAGYYFGCGIMYIASGALTFGSGASDYIFPVPSVNTTTADEAAFTTPAVTTTAAGARVVNFATVTAESSFGASTSISPPSNYGSAGGPTNFTETGTATGVLTVMDLEVDTPGDVPGFALTAAGAGPWIGMTVILEPVGSSVAYQPAQPITQSAAPGAPTNVVATPGDGQASVAFTAADGTATSYTVTSSGGQTASGSASPIVVTGLNDGTAYTFTVVAENSGGTTSAASAASNSVTPTASPPSAPTFRDSAHSLYTTTATSVAVAVPSTFQVGDLMVLVLASAYDLPSITGGSTTSWNETFYNQNLNGAGGSARTVVLSRAMENADVGATFTLTDNNNSGSFDTSQNGVAALVAYYSSSTPVIDVQAQINDGRNSPPNGGFSDTSPATGPAVTTTGTNETIVNIFNSFQMGEISGTYTSRLYVDQSSTSNASSLLIDDAVQAVAGASTPDSYTFASANSAQVITIALKA